MPVLASVHPKCFVWVIKQKGWKILAEDTENWLMGHPTDKAISVLVPKIGDLIATEIIESLVRKTIGENDFIQIKNLWNEGDI